MKKGKPEKVNGLLFAYPLIPWVYMGDDTEGETALIDVAKGNYTNIAGITRNSKIDGSECFPCYINPSFIVSAENSIECGECLMCEVLMNSGERFYLPYWWEDTDEISNN